MNRRLHQGFGLIELLVSLVVVGIALVGILQLYARAQTSELESYQRAQALVMLSDMASRLDANRVAASCYQITDPASGTPFVGVDNTTVFSCAGAGSAASRAMADTDLAQWDGTLKGDQERLGGANVGGIVGARGCIWADAAGEVFTVSVAWQGRSPTTAPANPCGQGLYGQETLRRVVSTTVRLADLN